MVQSEEEQSRRQHNRWKVFEIAAIHTDDGSAPCVIDDVSESGVLVSCALALEPGQKVIFELEEFGDIPSTVKHVRDTLYGLSLDFTPERQKEFVVWLNEIEKEDRD